MGETMAAEPTTATAAGTLAVNGGALAALGHLGLMNYTMGTYLFGTAFSILGAVSWQFMNAKAARESAEKNGTKQADLPRIDKISLGYAMCGAPLSSGCITWLINVSGGTQDYVSVPLYMLAGAAGPPLVTFAINKLMVLFGGGK